MPKKLKYVTISLHISAVIYALIFVACVLALFFIPFDSSPGLPSYELCRGFV